MNGEQKEIYNEILQFAQTKETNYGLELSAKDCGELVKIIESYECMLNTDKFGERTPSILTAEDILFRIDKVHANPYEGEIQIEIEPTLGVKDFFLDKNARGRLVENSNYSAIYRFNTKSVYLCQENRYEDMKLLALPDNINESLVKRVEQLFEKEELDDYMEMYNDLRADISHEI